MNHSHIGMDRTEQSGLAAAVIIHLALAAALWFGMQSVPEPVIKPEAISVSLIGEIAPVSTAPDAAAEAALSAEAEAVQPAPPADAAPEAPAPTPAPALPPKSLPKVDVKPVSAPKVTPPKIIPPKPPTKPQPKAAVKTVPKKIEKVAKNEPAKKPATTAKAPDKPAAKQAAKPTAKPIKSGGFGKGFEERIAGVGRSVSAPPAAVKSPATSATNGTASGTPASKSGAEVRRSVTTALAGQIRPFLQSCAPSGVDVDKISTFITVNLASNGDVTSVAFDKQTGVNESNRPQADPLRQCAVKAAKQAAPYRGLDPEYHDLWRSHKLQLKAR